MHPPYIYQAFTTGYAVVNAIFVIYHLQPAFTLRSIRKQNCHLALCGIRWLNFHFNVTLFYFILIISLFYTPKIKAQCGDPLAFKKQISLIYESEKNDAIKLSTLLNIEKSIDRCKMQNDSVSIYLHQKIGVLYSRKDDYSKAEEHTLRSITIAKKCLAQNRSNTLPIVEGYYNLFYYYEMSNQPEKKYQAIDSSIAYALKEGQGLETILPALEDKVQYTFNKGEYDECIKNATLAEEILREHYSLGDSIIRSKTFIGFKANAIYYSGHAENAETFLMESKTRIEANKHFENSLAIYGLLGIINRDKKKYSKALEYFEKEWKIANRQKDKFYYAPTLVQIGMLYGKNFRQYEKGLTICAQALTYADGIDSLFIFKEMGNIYSLQHTYGKAQDCFQKAFSSFEQGFDETKILKSTIRFPSFNLFQNLFDLTTDKANAYLNEYYYTKNKTALQKALSIYRIADLFLAKIKADQHLQLKSNLVWRNTARSLYERAIEACYASNNLEDAFYFFEKSRAVLLNDQIYEQRWMSNEDVAKRASLKKEIVDQERKLNEIPASSTEYFAVQHQLFELTQQQETLAKTIREKNPLFYENYMDTSSLSLKQVKQNILKANTSLVEIYTGDSAVYVLCINADGEKLTKADKQAYDSIRAHYMHFISHPNDLNRNFAGFTQASCQLYSLLFSQHSIPDGSIIISPDGNSFPFEALVINNNALSPDYFLNHYATSYTYSAKYLSNHFTSASGKKNNFLGIAPVQYKPETQLASLYGSDQSLKRIEEYYNVVTAFVSENATKNNFMQHFPDYSIIQLYTHASDSSATGDPVIYFADSALYLSDLISERKPVTQLVILSACETANGKLYRGEGIFSFNRGFAALGIPAAISNLWSVDEQATYKITELFYKFLSEGIPTDVALQQAKKAFMSSGSKENTLPYYWAASILTGKVDVIKNENRLSVPVILFIAFSGLCIIGLLAWFLNKRSKK